MTTSQEETTVGLVGIDYLVGPNRVAHTGDWGINGLFAYGAGSNVAIYDPEKYKIITMLRGHTDRVNAVQWVKKTGASFADRWFTPETILMSGGADNQIILWEVSRSGESRMICKMKEHKESVTSLSSLLNEDGSILLSSTSADNTCVIYKSLPDSHDFKVTQRINFKPKMMECVAMSHLPNTSTPIIAFGGVDSMIHLYIANNESIFVRVVQLQGHEDWIRCLQFATTDDGDLLLASCSQDAKIRIWKLGKSTGETEKMINALKGEEGMTSLSTKGHLFRYNGVRYHISLESVLSSHQEWVYSVHWSLPTLINHKYHQDLCVVSASMDRSVIIWEYLPSQSIWIDKVRVGEIGGNTLGFYGGFLSASKNRIISHGYNGSLHMWSTSGQDEGWRADVIPSGHFGGVMDMDWDTQGDYLISVSEDQTARCFSEWKQNKTWHEIARPAIHGHDLSCSSFLHSRDHSFVTGAEEKVIRVFEGPQTFVDTLMNISNVKTTSSSTVNRPLGANVPPLGLSNKPIIQGEEANKYKEENEYESAAAPAPIVHHIPPFEDHLFQSTLWPESQKLYGHPNEMVAVCSNHSGTLLASACKGTQPEESSIRIWDTTSWKEVAKLTAHKLSVAQLEFSHDDQYLLSVSRDRSYAVFKMSGSSIQMEHYEKSAHERIIWSGSWSYDDRIIATGSRDKLVKLWYKPENSWKHLASLPAFASSVTCVSWSTQNSVIGNDAHSLAVGLEDGSISVWNIDKENNIRLVYQLPESLCHGDAVRRLRWRNKKVEGNVQLASCSMDHSVRIHTLRYLAQ